MDICVCLVMVRTANTRWQHAINTCRSQLSLPISGQRYTIFTVGMASAKCLIYDAPHILNSYTNWHLLVDVRMSYPQPMVLLTSCFIAKIHYWLARYGRGMREGRYRAATQHTAHVMHTIGTSGIYDVPNATHTHTHSKQVIANMNGNEWTERVTEPTRQN